MASIIVHDAMIHDVTIADVEARPTMVVAATTTWAEYPALWRELLNEVWGCLQAGGTSSGCPNMMLYLDDVPRVEVGVITDRPCPLEGRVVVSSLPAGRLATTVHRGPYAGLGAAHGAVRSWCRERQLTVVGPRREVYGPHRDDPAEAWTEISYLLA